MTARTVVLWRHGRTPFNAQNRFQGQLDVPLDDVGRVQAAAAAAHLSTFAFDAVVASDLSRAVDTAAALTSLTGHVLTRDPALREVDAGEWQGLLGTEIARKWPEEHAAWRRGEDVRMGGGENRTELGLRVAGAVERHAAAVADGGALLIASHGAALKAGVLRLVGLPVSAGGALAGFRNCHWALLTRRAGGWVLEEYNAGPAGAGVGAEG
ncbi:histidine phosphatase family protein [Kineococcus sp. SYSU DK003]|uniref:histidine phosphatase family protein n=1 Tax=Kineococcus sp. SYSU DK003 TaxID=3383124 RepID=UPI003D7D02E3